MPITPLFAAIFALIYVILSLSVVKQRLSKKIILGIGDDDREFERTVRIHGNFNEYVPLSLILLWFVETIVFSHRLALVLGCVLLLSRLAHVIGLSKPRSFVIGRQIGMIGTFSVIIIASAVLIRHYLPI